LIAFKNDDIRLLLTKTFQKKRCKKKGKEILMDIILKKKKESTMSFIYQLLQVILTQINVEFANITKIGIRFP
jgi:hypothetical protein